MSSTDRQNRLLLAEDWTRLYQTFRNADFQSYDFENLRRVMINYLRENYPEDFNDYIESSEYLALIDIIAFLGQSISYRIDLNARDNFLELAERRESILRLARMLSYNPKRTIAASGLLKFTAVSTTQNVFDSNGRNIAGQTVSWNDSSNPNWYDQFIKIINAALPASRQFGNPEDRKNIQGIFTEQYRLQAANTGVPVYSFSKVVDGRSMDFEAVSTTIRDSEEIYEEPPLEGNRLSFLYRNDNRGNGSINSGFFVHFRQGILNQGLFTIDQPSTNESVEIDAVNINNSDVWLYKLDQLGVESELWAQVPALKGNNVIYNSLRKNIKNIYNVITRTNDRVTLLFSDGTFGNLPRGTFRTYYRVSNGISYTINPRDIRGVTIDIPYISNVGQIENLTVTLSLMTSVGNASSAESNTSIKANAPATYYTQNRMITAEDYNISPLSTSQEVIKVKSVNRSSSGISRYFDLIDPSGKYSEVNLFADDGALYVEEYSDSFRFSYLTKTDIEGVIYNQIIEKIKTTALRDFYYTKFPKKFVSEVSWFTKTVDTNLSTGYIGYTDTETPVSVGNSVENNLSFLRPGALVKFTAPVTEIGGEYFYSYFDKSNNNALIEGISSIEELNLIPNAATEIWSKVISVSGDGTGIVAPGEFREGVGTIVLNDIVPYGALVSEIIPPWITTLSKDTISSMIGLIFSNKPFGLRYDVNSLSWKIVTSVNLDLYSDFSISNTGDTTSRARDASWLVLFTTDTEFYTVKFRLNRYIFESLDKVRFYFDSSDNIFNSNTRKVVKDKIIVLGINTRPNSIQSFSYDKEWEVFKEYIGTSGYVDNKKIQITFNDSDNDGVVDNPEIFDELVGDNLVVLERYANIQSQPDYRVFDNSNNVVLIVDSESQLQETTDFNNRKMYRVNDRNYYLGQYFYFKDTNLVKRFVDTSPLNKLEISTDYKVIQGRNKLKFQYLHIADFDARIDPGLTNIIDIYVLTQSYDRIYRQWLLDSLDEEPLPPSTEYLYSLMAPELNKIKSISDEIIYHPVRYKILFGNRADEELRATFKVTKSQESTLSDNDIKSKVLIAINDFFRLENWDFGDSFYFTELSSYVMNRLAPNISNFVIVPQKEDLAFGSLFEIQSENDQIFVNGSTIDDIEIISSITTSNIRASSSISTMPTNTITQQIISAGNTNGN
jgi:hypothetical protein